MESTTGVDTAPFEQPTAASHSWSKYVREGLFTRRKPPMRRYIVRQGESLEQIASREGFDPKKCGRTL